MVCFGLEEDTLDVCLIETTYRNGSQVGETERGQMLQDLLGARDANDRLRIFLTDSGQSKQNETSTRVHPRVCRKDSADS